MKEFREDFDTVEEIVGIQIGAKIYTGKTALVQVLEQRKYTRLISRKVAEFMANLDVCPFWENLGKLPTFFTISSDEFYNIGGWVSKSPGWELTIAKNANSSGEDFNDSSSVDSDAQVKGQK